MVERGEQGGVRVDDHEIDFSLPDPEHRLAGVRLLDELDLPDAHRDFAFDEGRWRLGLPRPPALRLEYQLQLRHPDGGTETVTDPGNPATAPGAFGPKSVLELPDYRAPAWLAAAEPWPVRAELELDSPAGPVALTVRAPEQAPSRLLLAHDGPEYDALSALGGFAAAAVRDRGVPPFQLALAAPGPRDERYSANPDYTAALAEHVLPAAHAALGTRGPAVLMGASLGGLAALHLQRGYPQRVAGLFLQSGSFFTPELDGCEAGFPYFERIVAAVAAIRADQPPGRPVPAVLTCGTAEENLRNNRLLAASLHRQGYPGSLREVPDAHNYVAWRDAFDPHLVELLTAVAAEGRWGDA